MANSQERPKAGPYGEFPKAPIDPQKPIDDEANLRPVSHFQHRMHEVRLPETPPPEDRINEVFEGREPLPTNVARILEDSVSRADRRVPLPLAQWFAEAQAQGRIPDRDWQRIQVALSNSEMPERVRRVAASLSENPLGEVAGAAIRRFDALDRQALFLIAQRLLLHKENISPLPDDASAADQLRARQAQEADRLRANVATVLMATSRLADLRSAVAPRVARGEDTVGNAGDVVDQYREFFREPERMPAQLLDYIRHAFPGIERDLTANTINGRLLVGPDRQPQPARRAAAGPPPLPLEHRVEEARREQVHQDAEELRTTHNLQEGVSTFPYKKLGGEVRLRKINEATGMVVFDVLGQTERRKQAWEEPVSRVLNALSDSGRFGEWKVVESTINPYTGMVTLVHPDGRREERPVEQCLREIERPVKGAKGVEIKATDLQRGVVRIEERGKGEKVPMVRELPILEVLNDVQEARRRWEEKQQEQRGEENQEAPLTFLQWVGRAGEAVVDEVLRAPWVRRGLWAGGMVLLFGSQPLGLLFLGGAGVWYWLERKEKAQKEAQKKPKKPAEGAPAEKKGGKPKLTLKELRKGLGL